MINVEYPRRGFVVEEIVEGCKTEGCNAEKFVVNSWEHYGEDTFNDLTKGCKRGEHSASYGDIEGACPKCRKPVIYKNYFVVTSDASDIKTAEDAVAYAVNVLQAPFPEGEALIATDAQWSFNYAHSVLKGRFLLGEALIATDAQFSLAYARDISKAPFPLGEKAIATNAGDSYYYATQVLQAPFPLGEAVIATDAHYFKKYKELFPESQVVEPAPPKVKDKEYYEKKIKVEFTFSVHQLKILLESTSYFLDGMEDDEEHEFKANKVDVAELNQTLEKIVKRDNKFP